MLCVKYLKDVNVVFVFNCMLLLKYFGKLLVYGMEVVCELLFSEVVGGVVYVVGFSCDGVCFGCVYVYLFGIIDVMLLLVLCDLMCYEGVLGYVMQGDIQVGQSGGLKFCQSMCYVVFGEGWGFYVEVLCKEMGVFFELFDDFMWFDVELFWVVCLVVDIGIYVKGWIEQQVIDYFVKIGCVVLDQGWLEVCCYIMLLGQVIGYKIGMFKIVELCCKVECELGVKFDICGFYDLFIGLGFLLLLIFECQVDGWIVVCCGI